MINKKWIVPGLFVLGLLLVTISFCGPQSGLHLSGNEPDLAVISEKSGSVLLRNNEMPQPISIKLNTALKARDIIRTEAESDVLVQFNNDGQFRVVEKSEVLIDTLENGNPLVVVRSGDLYIEKFGRAPSFWIRKDGQLLSAVDFALSDKKNQVKLKEPLPDQKNNQSQLAQTDIEAILNSKKTDFFKCYGQILQKNPTARGQVLLSFTIEKQGHTSKIEVSKSEIADNTFKSCLMEVVARLQFKPFSGPPVTTVFPLKFE